MTDVALRDLRNDTSGVLRRVEQGERLRITVSGRPVAEIIPLPRRRRFISWAALSQTLATARADARLADDLRATLCQTRPTTPRFCEREPPDTSGAAVADTSLFIAQEQRRSPRNPPPGELAVSVVTVGELRLGVLAANDPVLGHGGFEP